MIQMQVTAACPSGLATAQMNRRYLRSQAGSLADLRQLEAIIDEEMIAF